MHNSCSIFLIFNFPNQCFRWIVQIQRNIYACATRRLKNYWTAFSMWLIDWKKNALCYYCFLMKILWNSWLYYSMEYCKIFMKFKVPFQDHIMKFPQFYSFYSAVRNLAIFCSLIFISHCSFVSLMIFFLRIIYWFLLTFSNGFRFFPIQIRIKSGKERKKKTITIKNSLQFAHFFITKAVIFSRNFPRSLPFDWFSGYLTIEMNKKRFLFSNFIFSFSLLLKICTVQW